MSTVKSISIVTSSYLIQTLTGLLFYIIIARNLPITEVGAITLFLSFGAIFSTAFSLNLDIGFAHFISYIHGKTGKYGFPRAFMILSFTMVIVALLFITLLSSDISRIFFHSPQYRDVVLLMGVYVSETIGLGYLVSILQGMQSFKNAALSNIVFSVLSMGIPIFLSFFQFPVYIVATGFTIGAGVSVIFALFFVISSRLSKRELEDGLLGRFFAYVTPIFLGSLFTALMGTVDRIILPALTNLSVSAVYSYSLTIATIVTAITSPFAFLLFPKVSQHFGISNPSEVREYAQGSIELFYFIGLPASIGAAILSRQLLSVLVGGIYAGHYIILQIMVFSYSFFSFRPILTSIILGFRRTGVYLYSGAGALAANLLISLIFIPSFGIYGAVAASITAWGVSTIPRMVSLGSILNHDFNFKPFLKMWINVTLMALAVLYAVRFFPSGIISLFIPALFGAILYFILSIINKPFSSEVRSIVESILTEDNHILTLFTRIILGKKNTSSQKV